MELYKGLCDRKATWTVVQNGTIGTAAARLYNTLLYGIWILISVEND